MKNSWWRGSHERGKGVAAAVAHIVKDVGYLKDNLERTIYKLVVIKKCMSGICIMAN